MLKKSKCRPALGEYEELLRRRKSSSSWAGEIENNVGSEEAQMY